MLENLFSPMKIGNLEIANRLVVSAMVTLYCHDGGRNSSCQYHNTGRRI